MESGAPSPKHPIRGGVADWRIIGSAGVSLTVDAPCDQSAAADVASV